MKTKTTLAALVLSCSLIAGLTGIATAETKIEAKIEAKVEDGKQFTGIASFYTKGMKGKTASGAKYDETQLTAAHKTLPFGTKVTVTCANSNRSVTVVINDRGPFVKGRVIDLSYAAATALGLHDRGLTQVTAVIE